MPDPNDHPDGDPFPLAAETERAFAALVAEQAEDSRRAYTQILDRLPRDENNLIAPATIGLFLFLASGPIIEQSRTIADRLHAALLAGWSTGAVWMVRLYERAERAATIAREKLRVFPPAPRGGGLPPGGGGTWDFPPTPPPSEYIPRFPVIEDAIRRMTSAKVLPPEEYYAASERLRRQAFTVSGDLTNNALEQIRGEIESSLRGDTNREKFTERMQRLPEVGKLSEAHIEQVFRNNVNGAYSDGAETIANDPQVVGVFPYRRYDAIHDERVRENHLALESLGLDGTNVYHHSDPTWKTFRPAWEWNCRCGWSPVTIRSAQAAGVAEAGRWLATGIEPEHLFVTPPDFAPPESWQREAV